MSVGTILIILPAIFLLGGFSGRFRGYVYGHRGIGVPGVPLLVVLVLRLFGRK